MSGKGGQVVLDAEEYIAILDRLHALEDELRKLGHKGFTTSVTTTRPPSPALRKKKEKTAAMVLDIDISGIEWKRSNRDGGGPAELGDGWNWAFGFTKDGGILPENVKLIQALEMYGKVRVGDFEISLSGRDGSLLNRKRLKT